MHLKTSSSRPIRFRPMAPKTRVSNPAPIIRTACTRCIPIRGAALNATRTSACCMARMRTALCPQRRLKLRCPHVPPRLQPPTRGARNSMTQSPIKPSRCWCYEPAVQTGAVLPSKCRARSPPRTKNDPNRRAKMAGGKTAMNACKYAP